MVHKKVISAPGNDGRSYLLTFDSTSATFMIRTRHLVPSLTALTALVLCACASHDVDAETARDGEVVERSRIRSMTFSSRNRPDPGTLESLKEIGVSHVTLIPFGYMRGHDAPEVHFEPNRRWFSESDAGISELADQARALGIKIILKPHIWVNGHSGEGQQRDRISFPSEAEWSKWETSYRRFIVYYAGLADRIGADVYVVGTELATAAIERTKFWKSVVADVRDVFGGKLTYAANWYREYETIRFWPLLDFVGVQAYFPISEKSDPDPADLRSGWDAHRRALEEVSRSTGKPILFTELGYRSVLGAAREPWRWASRHTAASEQPDYDLQADLYRAFFDEVWPQPWLAGVVIWRWHTDSESRGEVRRVDFTPQHKPSLEVLRDRFTADVGRDR